MAVNRRSQGTLSGAISRGINLDERYTFTSTEKDDLVANFESTVNHRLRNRLSHINTARELSMVSRGLKYILDEKLSSHQMQRRSFWTTRTNYRDTTETSCAISDSGTTELFMFKIVGGVKITEKYRLFMRFVKYEANLNWKVMSLVSTENEGSQQLRRMFNQANTSEGGSSRIDNAMVHLSNPPRPALANERPRQQPHSSVASFGSLHLSYLNHLIGEGRRSFTFADAVGIALIDFGIDDPLFAFALYLSLP